MPHAADRMAESLDEVRDAITKFQWIVSRLVGAFFFHPPKVEGHIAIATLQRHLSQQVELRRQNELLVIARAEMLGRENIIIVKSQFLRLGPRHRFQLQWTEPAMPVAGFFQGNIVGMQMAARIESRPPWKSDHVDFGMAGNLGADPSLPFHQFVTEFSHIGPRDKNTPRQKAHPEAFDCAADLIAQGKLVGHGFERRKRAPPMRFFPQERLFAPIGEAPANLPWNKMKQKANDLAWNQAGNDLDRRPAELVQMSLGGP
jgi:hypothetical protein